ncbi:NUDIX hydrolase [Shewanella sp. KX20019]|uniref:NUDIX hydrolase n=1 Tax=Shewanella sp. KX20019 TaxID=2803864 RepID=UPI001928145B|nr:NUDIX hydrolase [Shewanella sp. KX20019]QQX78616.1 NUDIX hydrolase [Shewanella sp. KX20019]
MPNRYKPNTTVACVIEANGKYLLVEELIDGEIKYNQPAGHLEPKESIIDACIREIKEETGLDIKPEGLVAIYQYTATEQLAFVRYTFYAALNKCVSSTPLDPAICSTRWLTFPEITALKPKLRSPLVLKCIEDYLNNKHYPLDLLNDQLL